MKIYGCTLETCRWNRVSSLFDSCYSFTSVRLSQRYLVWTRIETFFPSVTRHWSNRCCFMQLWKITRSPQLNWTIPVVGSRARGSQMCASCWIPSSFKKVSPQNQHVIFNPLVTAKNWVSTKYFFSLRHFFYRRLALCLSVFARSTLAITNFFSLVKCFVSSVQSFPCLAHYSSDSIFRGQSSDPSINLASGKYQTGGLFLWDYQRWISSITLKVWTRAF